MKHNWAGLIDTRHAINWNHNRNANESENRTWRSFTEQMRRIGFEVDWPENQASLFYREVTITSTLETEPPLTCTIMVQLSPGYICVHLPKVERDFSFYTPAWSTSKARVHEEHAIVKFQRYDSYGIRLLSRKRRRHKGFETRQDWVRWLTNFNNAMDAAYAKAVELVEQERLMRLGKHRLPYVNSRETILNAAFAKETGQAVTVAHDRLGITLGRDYEAERPPSATVSFRGNFTESQIQQLHEAYKKIVEGY